MDFSDLTAALEAALDTSQTSLFDAPFIIEDKNLSSLFTESIGVSPSKFLHYIHPLTIQKKILPTLKDLPKADIQLKSFDGDRTHLPVIYYGFYPTFWGECVVAVWEQGICGIEFTDNNRNQALLRIQKHFKQAIYKEAHTITAPFMEQVLQNSKKLMFNLWVNATPFQIAVWETLLKIPDGHFITYEILASELGNPQAAQAVGNAVGANPFALVVPCHRVVNKTGKMGDFRWGSIRKKLLVGMEIKAAENNEKTPRQKI